MNIYHYDAEYINGVLKLIGINKLIQISIININKYILSMLIAMTFFRMEAKHVVLIKLTSL